MPHQSMWTSTFNSVELGCEKKFKDPSFMSRCVISKNQFERPGCHSSICTLGWGHSGEVWKRVPWQLPSAGQPCGVHTTLTLSTESRKRPSKGRCLCECVACELEMRSVHCNPETHIRFRPVGSEALMYRTRHPNKQKWWSRDENSDSSPN